MQELPRQEPVIQGTLSTRVPPCGQGGLRCTREKTPGWAPASCLAGVRTHGPLLERGTPRLETRLWSRGQDKTNPQKLTKQVIVHPPKETELLNKTTDRKQPTFF